MMFRRLTALLMIAAAAPAAAQEIRARGEITVERVIIDAHITDDRGNPILGLTPSDFRVRIDGRPAEVESIEWIGSVPSPQSRVSSSDEVDRESWDSARGTRDPVSENGRLLIFFFQTDFARERVMGHMRMIAYATEMLETLLPDDRVAVVQFDSHLKVRLDFTADKEKLGEAIRESLLIDFPPPANPQPDPSLSRHLDAREAKRAASPERALMLLGSALQKIDGPKSLVFFAWGLGRFMGRGIGVQMTHEYAPAKRALEEARTAVFSLDISDADYHSLEVGLQQVSYDTGGFYEKTHLFPRFAVEKLQRTISGRYELVIKKPGSLGRGLHKIDIRLAGRRGNVLARSEFRDE